MGWEEDRTKGESRKERERRKRKKDQGSRERRVRRQKGRRGEGAMEGGRKKRRYNTPLFAKNKIIPSPCQLQF